MTAPGTPQLARGVRLKRDLDGAVVLLVPEGILRLNDSAAATLALVDGRRSFDDIVAALCSRFGIVADVAVRDAGELLDRLHARGYLTR